MATDSKDPRDQALQWLRGLTDNQVRKLLTLKPIVEDPCTCERISEPQRENCQWTVKWENKPTR
jgi:hypothetical protein